MSKRWILAVTLAIVSHELQADGVFFDEHQDVEYLPEPKKTKKEPVISPEEDLAQLVEEAEEEKKADSPFKNKVLVRTREKLQEKKDQGNEALTEQEVAEQKNSKEKANKSLSQKKDTDAKEPQIEKTVAKEEKSVKPNVILSPPKIPQKKPSGAYVKVERVKSESEILNCNEGSSDNPQKASEAEEEIQQEKLNEKKKKQPKKS